jgi:hypothetical protein
MSADYHGHEVSELDALKNCGHARTYIHRYAEVLAVEWQPGVVIEGGVDGPYRSAGGRRGVWINNDALIPLWVWEGDMVILDPQTRRAVSVMNREKFDQEFQEKGP